MYMFLEEMNRNPIIAEYKIDDITINIFIWLK